MAREIYNVLRVRPKQAEKEGQRQIIVGGVPPSVYKGRHHRWRCIWHYLTDKKDLSLFVAASGDGMSNEETGTDTSTDHAKESQGCDARGSRKSLSSTEMRPAIHNDSSEFPPFVCRCFLQKNKKK